MFTANLSSLFFFFNDTATTEIYTLSLHDALPRPDGLARQGGRMEQKADRRARRRMPMTHVLGNWQHGFLPVQGLADDPREKARSGPVGLSGPHADRRQADADAVEEAAARIVGEQPLRHRLLRAVACQRRAEEHVADRPGKRRAEHR